MDRGVEDEVHDDRLEARHMALELGFEITGVERLHELLVGRRDMLMDMS